MKFDIVVKMSFDKDNNFFFCSQKNIMGEAMTKSDRSDLSDLSSYDYSLSE